MKAHFTAFLLLYCVFPTFLIVPQGNDLRTEGSHELELIKTLEESLSGSHQPSHQSEDSVIDLNLSLSLGSGSEHAVSASHTTSNNPLDLVRKPSTDPSLKEHWSQIKHATIVDEYPNKRQKLLSGNYQKGNDKDIVQDDNNIQKKSPMDKMTQKPPPSLSITTTRNPQDLYATRSAKANNAHYSKSQAGESSVLTPQHKAQKEQLLRSAIADRILQDLYGTRRAIKNNAHHSTSQAGHISMSPLHDKAHKPLHLSSTTATRKLQDLYATRSTKTNIAPYSASEVGESSMPPSHNEAQKERRLYSATSKRKFQDLYDTTKVLTNKGHFLKPEAGKSSKWPSFASLRVSSKELASSRTTPKRIEQKEEIVSKVFCLRIHLENTHYILEKPHRRGVPITPNNSLGIVIGTVVNIKRVDGITLVNPSTHILSYLTPLGVQSFVVVSPNTS
ncbi:hypothetical protein O181_001199 [Austropuccinia psidii MF-1]|uniref:Uncharacterized protein n=1 Tax=Austropuccinia psidii MF-1 TaxID=1389203 RepID=A0A9Q3GBM1_9BASI|nr:hypothetical protein [Austropuccinia psidii MF-1]